MLGGLLGLFLVLGPVGLAPAPAVALPGGPRLAFLEVQFPPQKQPIKPLKAGGEPSASVQLVSVDPNGHGRRPFPVPGGLTLAPLGKVSWSADGSRVAFLAARAAGGLRVYVADADGTHARPVPGTERSISVVLSPDGRTVAFDRRRPVEHIVARPLNHHAKPLTPKQILEELEQPPHFEGQTTWIAPAAGGKPRRLTPWADGEFAQPSSFSPDGSLLALDERASGGKELIATVDLATGARRTVEADAAEASFSPDGTKIAFTTYRDGGSVPGFDEPEGTKELYVADADGSDARRLTDTPESDELAPSWDPSGERLAYLRTPGGLLQFLGIKGEVVESNADGTCATAVAEPRPRLKRGSAAVQPPTWVPGPNRGVGPLSC